MGKLIDMSSPFGFTTETGSEYFFVYTQGTSEYTLYSPNKLETESPVYASYAVYDAEFMKTLIAIEAQVTHEQLRGLVELGKVKEINLQSDYWAAEGNRIFVEFADGTQLFTSEYKSPMYGPTAE